MQPKEREFEDKKEPEKKLTREQRRHMERVNTEANAAFDQITNKFLSEFITSDNPEGEEIRERAKQIDAQWRLYCTRKGLNPKAFPLVKKYCDEAIKQYNESKEKAELEKV